MRQQIQSIIDAHTLWLDTDGREGEQANFEKMNLQEIDFQSLNLCNSIFRNANLIRANISDCQLDGSDFTNADLSYSKCTNNTFKHCNLTNTNFDGSTINNSDFSSTKLKQTNFSNSKTRYLNFSHVKCVNSVFDNAVLLGANFKKAILDHTHFNDTNISKVIFEETELINVNLDTAIGVAAKDNIIKIEEVDDEYIARKSQMKLLKKLSRNFYTLGSLLAGVIIFIIIFEFYNMFIIQAEKSILDFNYFAWILLDIFLIILATFFNMLMNWIIRDDKRKSEERNRG